MVEVWPVNRSDLTVYEATFEHCAVGLAHVAADGRFLNVNSAFCDFLGYSKSQILKLSFQQLTPGEHLASDEVHVNALLAGEEDIYTIEKPYIHRDGHWVWARLTVSLVRTERGEPDFFISVIEDIDDRKRIETRLHESEELFRQIILSLSDRMLVWVAEPNLKSMRYVNGGYAEIWGRPVMELYQNPMSFIHHIHAADRQRILAHYGGLIEEDWQHEYRVMRDDGELRYIREKGIVVRDVNGDSVFIVGCADDITKDKGMNSALLEANMRLERLSRTDDLTGVYNRREIEHIVQRELSRLKRQEGKAVLLFLDLDDFKSVNDTYGHSVGDRALKAFCDAISGQIRDSDSLGRYGGDEFLLMLYNTDFSEAEQFCQRLRSTPIEVSVSPGKSFSVAYSIGMCQWEPTLENPDQWIEHADSQMYGDKRQT